MLFEKLETANFIEFWNDLKTIDSALLKPIANFTDLMREFIADVFSITYQIVDKSLLISSLNLNEEEFKNFVGKKEWKVEGEFVSIPLNENNQTRPQKTLRPITTKRILFFFSNFDTKFFFLPPFFFL